MKMIPASLSRVVARQSLQIQKNSPTLLFGAGVVGMIGSTVLACRSTLRLEEVVEKTQKDLDTAREMEHENYSETDRRKDITLIYTRGVVDMTKLYGPSVLLSVAAIGCLTKSHNLLQQRNSALTAAYVALDEGFAAYRKRVIEKYGEQQDREFRYSSEEVTVIDEETGKTSIEQRAAPDAPSIYARFFDQFCESWSTEPEYNMVYLSNKQNYWNDILKARGHVFLNEIYDDLGLPHSRAGAVVGWVRNSRDGDGYIDFGIFDSSNQRRIDFINGREGAVLLDFNVDGVVYDKIEKPEEKISWQS